MVQCGESRPVVAYVTFHTHKMIIYSIGNVCGAVNVVRTWFYQLTWQPLWSKLIQPSQVMGEGPAVCSLQVWSIDYAYRIAVVSSVLIIDCNLLRSWSEWFGDIPQFRILCFDLFGEHLYGHNMSSCWLWRWHYNGDQSTRIWGGSYRMSITFWVMPRVHITCFWRVGYLDCLLLGRLFIDCGPVKWTRWTV